MTPRVLIEPARLAGSTVLRCQTDDRLVDLVRAGNDRAFEAMVDRYRRPLVRYCARLLPPGRAEDAVQQAFLNAYGALQRGDRHIELRPWLYRIAHNAALNSLRENGWSHEHLDTVLHRPGADTTHETAERRASLRTVLAAVQDLPDRQRDAMILRELEGRTYEQIGVELNASGGAVRQLLNRARHTVRTAVTALTPLGLLARVPWTPGAPVIERVTEAASHDALRTGAARLGGAVVASVAVAAGLADGTKDFPRAAPEGRPTSDGAATTRATNPSPRLLEGAVAAAPARGVPRLVRLPAAGPPRMAPVPPRLPERVLPRARPQAAAPAPAGGGFAPRSSSPAPHSHPTSPTTVQPAGNSHGDGGARRHNRPSETGRPAPEARRERPTAQVARRGEADPDASSPPDAVTRTGNNAEAGESAPRATKPGESAPRATKPGESAPRATKPGQSARSGRGGRRDAAAAPEDATAAPGEERPKARVRRGTRRTR